MFLRRGVENGFSLELARRGQKSSDMRGFASDFAPTSSECSVKAQVTNHQGSARAFRGRIQAHISAFFVSGWVDLNGLDSPFSELG